MPKRRYDMTVEGKHVQGTGKPNTPPAGQAPAVPPVDGQAPDTPPENNNQPQGDDLGFSEKQQAYIKTLREESAKYRTKAKGLDERLSSLEGGLKGLFGGDTDKEMTPEERIAHLEATVQQDMEQRQLEKEQLESQNNLLQLSLSHGITEDNDREFFEFKLQRAMYNLEEGEHLSEEEITEIATMVKSKSAKSSTSVGAGKSAGTPQGKAGMEGDVTLDQFVKMNMGEKSMLYRKDPTLYKTLIQAAKDENRLVKLLRTLLEGVRNASNN